MKKEKFNVARSKVAQIFTSLLCAVLFICANTNSCGMVYQPEAPSELAQFRKIR